MTGIPCKCKSCGGTLTPLKGSKTIAVCDYCMLKQTIPQADDEKKAQMFDKATNYLRSGEFDRASNTYDAITDDYPQEAEAYWGLLLSHYGIQYVENPDTKERKPTCNRADFNSILEDRNFLYACDYSDALTRAEYVREAEQLEDLRQRIIEVSSKEEPYDIFISYKQKDSATGERTEDSLLASNLYEALKREGYRVFFAEVTLENKLGLEYEPLIFSALHSARIMLVVATRKEYVNAPWVKNEWSRYLRMIEKDSGASKVLIPCYRDMKAYDLPKEFNRLQAQDLSKLGAIHDVVRGVNKIMGRDQSEVPNSPGPVRISGGPSAENYFKRGQLDLQAGIFDSAEKHFDSALNINAEHAEAYAGKLCCKYKVKKLDELGNAVSIKLTRQYQESRPVERLDSDPDFQRALRFGDESLQRMLKAQENRSLELQKSVLEGLEKSRFAEVRKQKELVSAKRKELNILSGKTEAVDKQEALLNQEKETIDGETEEKHQRWNKLREPLYYDFWNIVCMLVAFAITVYLGPYQHYGTLSDIAFGDLILVLLITLAAGIPVLLIRKGIYSIRDAAFRSSVNASAHKAEKVSQKIYDLRNQNSGVRSEAEALKKTLSAEERRLKDMQNELAYTSGELQAVERRLAAAAGKASSGSSASPKGSGDKMTDFLRSINTKK